MIDPRAPSVVTSRAQMRDGAWSAGERIIAEETAIAIVVDGGAEAVMMGTPADIEDFAYGFALTEGVVDDLTDIRALEIAQADLGIEARLWLKAGASSELMRRRRRRAGPVGCGLCGVESLEDAMRPFAPVTSDLRVSAKDILAAMASLAPQQPLFEQTRAVHAAAFYTPLAGVKRVREDVGRHNALDKLIGALARNSETAADGLILMTSRVSIELIQKAARIGAPILAAISAPTALAVRTAETANLTLCGVVRDNGLEVFTHERRILREASDGP